MLGDACRKLLLVLGCALPALAGHAAPGPEPGPVPLATLREHYAGPTSRYLVVDGVELHYADEGAGFPVLLLNASYTTLDAWRHVVAALSDAFRVIRLDFPATGLSGTETRTPPGGRWDVIGRNVEIVGALLDRLDIEGANIIGSSTGGSVAFHFASSQPERVNRLVLINAAGMPRTPQTDPNRERADIEAWQRMTYKPRAYWAYSVGRNFPSGRTPPAWFLDTLYDSNRRTPAADPAQYRFRTGDPKTVLAGVEAPTLILWGRANPTVMHLEADVLAHWMTAAPTLVRKYDGLGHYPFIEAPARIIPDIRAFLAGKLDGALRLTVRKQVSIDAR